MCNAKESQEEPRKPPHGHNGRIGNCEATPANESETFLKLKRRQIPYSHFLQRTPRNVLLYCDNLLISDLLQEVVQLDTTP